MSNSTIVLVDKYTSEVIVNVSESTLVVTNPTSNVIVSEISNTELINSAQQGPAGPPGPDGTGAVVVTAGEALGGGRVVMHENDEAFYSSSDVQSSMDKVIGVTIGAVIIGAESNVRASGELIDSSWSWASGPIYNGLNGIMTQTVPSTGFVLQIATALSPTKILINIKQGILRI